MITIVITTMTTLATPISITAAAAPNTLCPLTAALCPLSAPTTWPQPKHAPLPPPTPAAPPAAAPAVAAAGAQLLAHSFSDGLPHVRSL